MIKITTLKELYRVDNKYWKTGDTDILPKRHELAMEIDNRLWSDLCGVVAIATKHHRSVKELAEALKILGYEVEEVDDGT